MNSLLLFKQNIKTAYFNLSDISTFLTCSLSVKVLVLNFLLIITITYSLGSISAVSRVRSLILPEEGMSGGSFSRTAAGNRQ